MPRCPSFWEHVISHGGDAGGVWAIYPEGTRSTTGRLHRGHTCLMRVALGRGCPVVPITLSGTERIRLWRPVRVDVVIGPPIDLAVFPRDPDDRAAVRAATDALMGILRRQGGMEYVDRYANPRGPSPAVADEHRSAEEPPEQPDRPSA